jgi:hypothetical protein
VLRSPSTSIGDGTVELAGELADDVDRHGEHQDLHAGGNDIAEHFLGEEGGAPKRPKPDHVPDLFDQRRIMRDFECLCHMRLNIIGGRQTLRGGSAKRRHQAPTSAAITSAPGPQYDPGSPALSNRSRLAPPLQVSQANHNRVKIIYETLR